MESELIEISMQEVKNTYVLLGWCLGIGCGVLLTSLVMLIWTDGRRHK
jgi:hypothetical protein